MAYTGKPLEELTEDDLRGMIGVMSEGRALDFKRELPGNSDADKREFLADVTAFANTAGGDIIFGMNEEGGVASELFGITADMDKEILRLENILRAGVDPLLSGVRFQLVQLNNDRAALVLRLPRSYQSPHMVTFGRRSNSQFYYRAERQKVPMEVSEIRAAIEGGAALSERIRQFRADRLGKIVAGETPLPLMLGGKIVLHIIPLSAFAPGSRLNLAAHSQMLRSVYPPLVSGFDSRYNLDGFLNYDTDPSSDVARHRQGSSRQGTAYLQFFDNWILEAVNAEQLAKNSAESQPTINLDFIEVGLRKNVRQYLAALRTLEIPTPLFVMLSILGVNSYPVSLSLAGVTANAIDRDDLVISEEVFANYDDDGAGMDQVMKSMFDALWRAAGFAGSPYYRADGRWNGPI